MVDIEGERLEDRDPDYCKKRIMYIFNVIYEHIVVGIIIVLISNIPILLIMRFTGKGQDIKSNEWAIIVAIHNILASSVMALFVLMTIAIRICLCGRSH